jgi:dihydroorotate dehydrogenase
VLIDTTEGGAAAADKSCEVLKRVEALSKGRLALISVGGVTSGSDVVARLDSGASLV